MRLPGWLIGLSVVAWLGATVICSVGAFIAAQQVQQQSAEIGLELPALAVRADRPTVPPAEDATLVGLVRGVLR